MNITQTIAALEAEGFTVENEKPRYSWVARYTAKRIDEDGNGIRVDLHFGDQHGRNGKPLTSAIAHCFPLFDGKRGLLNGAKARDFSAGRIVSAIVGSGVQVRTNGCTSALFDGGKFIGKF